MCNFFDMEHYNIVIKQLSIVTELKYCAFFQFQNEISARICKNFKFSVCHARAFGNGITYSLKIYGLVTLYSDLAYF